MALSTKTKLIALDQGLNTYGNPHRMKVGQLVSANGVGLDKDGNVYPAFQLSAYSASSGGVRGIGFSLGAYTASGSTSTDSLLVHSGNLTSPPWINTSVGGSAGPSPTVYPLTQATQTVYSNQVTLGGTTPYSNGAPQVCVSGNQLCYAWLDSIGHPFFMREDLTTGARETPYFLTSTGAASNAQGTPISAGFTKLGVAPNFNTAGVANGFILFALVPGQAAIQRLTITGNLGNASATLTTLTGTSFLNLDVAYDGLQTYVIANDSNTTLRAYRSGNSYSAATFPLTGMTSTSPISIFATNPIENSASPSLGSVIAATGTSVTGTVQFYFTNGSFAAGTSNSITGSTAIQQIAASISSAGSNVGWAFEYAQTYTSNGKTVASPYVVTAVTAFNAVPSAFSGKVQAPGGVALLGKPWPDALANGAGAQVNTLFPIRTGWHYSNGGSAASQIAYPNAYLIDINGSVVSKWGDRDVGSPLVWPAFDDANYTANKLPLLASPAVTAPGSATYAWPQLAYAEGSSAANATFGQPINPQVNICKAQFTYAQGLNVKYAQLGPELLIPASTNVVYDGSIATEAGFFTACPQPVCALASSGTGLTAGGTYFYVGVKQYVDASGRYHYSAPSLPTPAPTPTVGNLAMSINYPVEFLTMRSTEVNFVRYLTYRTQAGGSSGTGSGAAYYLVNSAIVNNVSIPAASGNPYTATVTDAASDTAILSAPKIYTSGYAAGASAGTTAPPPFFSTCVFANCVWGVSYRNGWELWFSWPLDNSVVQPEGLAWSSANRIPIPSDVGQVQAIAPLDSNLMIFGTLKDYVITGNPPARSSSQLDSGTFNPIIQLPTPSGMRVRNSVATVPQGIIFQGITGFMLLDRSLTYNDIGNEVNDLTNSTLYGPGALYAQSNAIIFPPIGAGVPLTYYYEEGDWSVPYSTSRVASNWQFMVGLVPFRVAGQVTNVGISAAGIVQVGPNATYMQAVTPWVEMTSENSVAADVPNVAGYGQLYEVQVQGDLRTDISFPYTMILQTEYDYSGNTQTPPDVQTITVSDSSAQVPGPADLNWRFGFTTGQARRVRFTLTFDATAGNYTFPLSAPLVAFSGMMLYYGVDSGLSRLGQGYSSATGGT